MAGRVGNVSEALQNLMMGHGDIRTFLKHYMDRQVSVDTAANVRGVEPQTAIFQAETLSQNVIYSLIYDPNAMYARCN
jgi:hypothetical protein